MNVHQKVGILVMRLLGTLVTLVGVMGILYFLVHLVTSSRDSGADRGSGIVSLVWAAVGPLLVAFARPIGRRLGSGLD